MRVKKLGLTAERLGEGFALLGEFFSRYRAILESLLLVPVEVSPLSYFVCQLLFFRVFLPAVLFPGPVAELLKAFDFPVSLEQLVALFPKLLFYGG